MCLLFAAGSIYESHRGTETKHSPIEAKYYLRPVEAKYYPRPVEAKYSSTRWLVEAKHCSVVEPRNISPLWQSIICPLWHNIARSLSPNICPLILIFMRRLRRNICSHIEGKCFSFFDAKHSCVDEKQFDRWGKLLLSLWRSAGPSHREEPYYIAWIAVTLTK